MREGRTHECYLRIDDDLHQCKIAISLLKGFHVQADLKARNPLQKEWSVDEEKLLLSFQEQQEPEFLPGYKLARKENPKLFNKFSATESDLRDHIRTLKNDQSLEYRYKLLKKDLESSAADHGDVLRPMGQGQAREQYKALPKLHKNVIIKLVSRNGNTASVEGNAHALSQHSPHLKLMLQQVPANKYEVKTIQLSEKDKLFADYKEVHDVFGADNISRYIEFTENPQVWVNKEKAQEQLKKLKTKQNTAWYEFQESLHKAREQHVAELREMQTKEEEVLVSELTKCLEDDKRQLIYLHKAHLNAELQKMKKRYEALINDVQEFYNSENSKLNELNLRYDETERVQVEQQVAEAEYHIKNIFPDKGLLRLLILADVLRDADLRTACLQRTASKITKFYKSPELGCELLRSMTLQELLSMCSNQQLIAIQQGKEFCFKEELLLKETSNRESQMAEVYRGWSLEELTNAQVAEKELFPHVLEEEIHRRRENAAGSYISIDVKKLNPNYILVDKERRTATLTKSHKYAAFVGSFARNHGGWGKWYWECKVVAFERSNGCTVSVGWDVPRQNYNDSYVPGLHEGDGGAFGCMWTSDGIVHHSGVAEDIFTTFDKDDILGIGLDQDRKLLTFYKNGQLVPMMKKKNDYRIPNDHYTLLPAVCMYSARNKQQVRVVAEFCGPFEVRVPKFFRPYGDSNPYRTHTDDDKHQ